MLPVLICKLTSVEKAAQVFYGIVLSFTVLESAACRRGLNNWSKVWSSLSYLWCCAVNIYQAGHSTSWYFIIPNRTLKLQYVYTGIVNSVFNILSTAFFWFYCSLLWNINTSSQIRSHTENSIRLYCYGLPPQPSFRLILHLAHLIVHTHRRAQRNQSHQRRSPPPRFFSFLHFCK